MDPSPRIILTGASRGIGLAVARVLVNKFNANVVALQRSQSPELTALAAEFPSLSFVSCDITNHEQLTSCIASAISNLGGLDGLILNAGTAEPFTTISSPTPLADWKHLFDVNFFSLVTALQASIPALRSSEVGGKVVFVSSGAAVKGTPGWGPYNASKAATNSLCRTMAEEEPGLTSIALRPGIVATDMQASIRSKGQAGMTKADHDKFVKLYTEGKLVKPRDPGYVIAALSVSAPKSLNGQFVSWDDENCKAFREQVV